MNGQNPSKESDSLKENHVAEQHEHGENGDQKRGSVFIHQQESGKVFASAFCSWGGKLCRSPQYTPQWQITSCEQVLGAQQGLKTRYCVTCSHLLSSCAYTQEYPCLA